MSRPLMQHGVAQLEEMFAKGGADLKVLEQLENELQYRQVPRAVALRAEVQAAIDSARPATPPHSTLMRPPAPQQPNLWERAPAPHAATETPPASPSRPATPGRPADTSAASNPINSSAPTMPLEDAHKLLRATAGSTWESIEQTRRKLVQQAYPGLLNSMSPERRAHVLGEARRVNAAYVALSRARCGGRSPF